MTRHDLHSPLDLSPELKLHYSPEISESPLKPSRRTMNGELSTPPQRNRPLQDHHNQDQSPLDTFHQTGDVGMVIDDIPASSMASSSNSPGLLPPLPISSSPTSKPTIKQRQKERISPPCTPPYVSSAQFSSPLRQHATIALSHPWDTPAPTLPSSSMSPSVRRRLGDGYDESQRRSLGPSGSSIPLQPPPPLDDTFHSSPIGWHRQSFARGGRSSPDDERLTTFEQPDLVVVPPQESDEDFMNNVQRIVDSGDEIEGTGSIVEERTPSPFVPGTPGPSRPGNPFSRLAHHNSMKRLPGGELDRLRAERDGFARRKQFEVESQRPDYLVRHGPTSPSFSPGRRPETRPARQIKRSSHKRTASDAFSSSSLGPSRTTRARNAKEVEDAIAAIERLEKAQKKVHGSKSKGKGRDSSHYASTDINPPPPRFHHPPPSFVAKGKDKAVEDPPSPEPSSSEARPGVGIAVSPVKGRRLKLLRHDSPPEAAFTSELPLVSGQVRQWLDAPGTPSKSTTPVAPPKEVDWGQVDLAALGIRIDQAVESSKDPLVDAELARRLRDAERESRKRRRLEAFIDDLSIDPAVSPPSRQSPLKPALVDGLGRMAIHPEDLQGARVVPLAAVENRSKTLRKTLFGMEVQQDDDSLMSGLNTGGAGLRDLWTNNGGSVAASAASAPMPDVAFPTGVTAKDVIAAPNWPDSRYPWSAAQMERKRAREERQMERLKLVESFLARESDSDSDEEGGDMEEKGQSEDDTTVVAGARGLWALAQDGVSPSRSISHHLGSLFPLEDGPSDIPASLFGLSPSPVAPSDPADARFAFASRRDVRSTLYLAAKRREAAAEHDEGEVDCDCGGPDDGRAMVRCDGCRTWSHQECANILDESQLGECWYCSQCAAIGYGVDPPSPPTLVQAEDDVTPDEASGQIFLRGVDNPSPVLLPSTPSPTKTSWPVPKTPKARIAPKLTTRTWLETPSRRTPRFSDDFQHDVSSAASLDPMSTPSRGTKYGMAFVSTTTMTTPKVARKLIHDVGNFATPTSKGLRYPVIASTPTLKGHSGFSSPPSSSLSCQYTDTPIQRSRAVFGGLAPSLSVDSPIARNRKAA